ncbi:MAG TPA: hypothetical protein VHV10_02505 [Ktedonobacteraceae bacterium]|jgi:hypothetical protein|nr:hypothetical protein [Ktedonobacteraceae bacterium]
MQNNTNDLAQRCYNALNKLTKWRSVFASWQLGTRVKGNPEGDAIRDHREVTILLTAENSAFIQLLLNKHVFTLEEFEQRVQAEQKEVPSLPMNDVSVLSPDDPTYQAICDHRATTVLLRAGSSVLTRLLIERGVFTLEEFQQALIDEAEQLSKDYEGKFPGMKATDIGIQYDRRASETMKGWRP